MPSVRAARPLTGRGQPCLPCPYPRVTHVAPGGTPRAGADPPALTHETRLSADPAQRSLSRTMDRPDRPPRGVRPPTSSTCATGACSRALDRHPCLRRAGPVAARDGRPRRAHRSAAHRDHRRRRRQHRPHRAGGRRPPREPGRTAGASASIATAARAGPCGPASSPAPATAWPSWTPTRRPTPAASTTCSRRSTPPTWPSDRGPCPTR